MQDKPKISLMEQPNKKRTFLGRNKKQAGAFSSNAEEKILTARHDNQPASDAFGQRLKAKILEKRHEEKKLMQNPFKNFISAFSTLIKTKPLVPALVMVLIIAIIFGSISFWWGGERGKVRLVDKPHELAESLFRGFSKLMISPAYAEDNFELIPSQIDSLGVAGNTVYTLKSKESLNIDLIKNHLRVEPQMAYEIREISDKEWQITFKEIVEPNTMVKLALATSYINEQGKQEERDYAWVYQVKDSFKVLHSIPRNKGVDVPINTGIEVTFSHDNFSNFDKYFSIEPKVDGRFEKHARTMVFIPKEVLKRGVVYRVRVGNGLPLTGSGEVLAEDYVFEFETERERSLRVFEGEWFRVYKKFYEVSSVQAPVIQVYANSLPKNEVEVSMYEYNNWQDFMQAMRQRDKLPWWSYSKDDWQEDVTKLNKLRTFKQNVKKNNRVQYIEFPENLPPGFYLLELSVAQTKEQAWLQVSDLSVYANITKTNTLIWVNDSNRGGVVEGANVELIGSGYGHRTDHQGVANFKTPKELLEDAFNEDKSDRFYFKISQGNNVLIQPASQLSRYYYWQRPTEADDYWYYLYTDRPLYQPTDKIKFWGLLKQRNEQKVDEEVTITLFKSGYVDYYYRPVEIVRQRISLSEMDTFQGEIDLKNVRPDYYNLEVKVGDVVIIQKYISIRSYTKPAYEISLIPERKRAFAGENINLEAGASFFEGTPVPDLDLVFQMPEGVHQFKTDETGKAKLTYQKDYFDCQEEYKCWPRYASLSLKPKESELAEISADTYVRFYGPKVYMTDQVSYPEEGIAEIEILSKKIDLESVEENSWWSSDLGEEIAPNTRITGEVIKITYTKRETGTYYNFITKKTYKTYSYDRHEAKIDSFEVRTDDRGKYIYRRQVEPETSYQVKLRLYDQDGRYDNYYTYLYYYNGRSTNRYTGYGYEYYHFEFDKETAKYAVGEEVKVRFMLNDELMPDDENGYLYLQLQNGLQEYAVEGDGEYNFKFEDRDIPNVNLLGVHFNGISYTITQTGYYNGGVSLDTKNKVLDIEVKTDKDKYEPGEQVNLSLQVKDAWGKAATAEVNLNLIDEAFYAVMEDTASPLNEVYRNLGTGSLYTIASHHLVTQDMLGGGAEKGGCFAKGTKILMADGSEKPIEQIKIGDQVATLADPRGIKLESGEVTQVYQHMINEYLIINNNLKVTPEHLVYANGRFQEAGSLQVDDWILSFDGQRVTVDSIEIRHNIIPVYNFRVEPQHTYIANGFYVHNEKGGGPREFFTDAALFKSIKTGRNGQANINFKLPDNITSWRVTAQGLSRDLGVGVKVTKIPVSLPVFAEVTIGDEYLVEDRPIARLRAFGVELTRNIEANFLIKALSLGIERSQPLKALAFQAAYFVLPDLKPGQHDIIYELSTAKGNDAIKLPIEVIYSRLQAQVAKSEKLTTATQVKAENDLPINVVLSDQGQNQLYGPLEDLSWMWGDRIDQRLPKQKARIVLNKVYDKDYPAVKFDAFNYQVSSGGITLLPYSSEELELSARVASIGADGFDQESLAQYFFSILEDRKSNREEVTYALCGLAALDKPVLPRIQGWLLRDDLGPVEKLYLGQALYDLGAKEWSRSLYHEVMGEYAQKKEPQVMVKVGQTEDDTFKATALAAVLAASINAPERDGLWDYLLKNQRLWGRDKNSENLFNLEKINFIEHTLPNLKPSPAKVEYEFLGQKRQIEITGGHVHSFSLEPAHIAELKFLSIEGEVGISMNYTKMIEVGDIKPDSDIGISREYYVNGKKTNTFKESDLIEVRLYPSFKDSALTGSYQITDILPSGLMPVTKLYTGSSYHDCHYWYPYNTDGQMVKYRIDKNWRNNYCGGDYIKYYARVKNRGEYKAEPAIMQSLINPEYINYSASERIEIGN